MPVSDMPASVVPARLRPHIATLSRLRSGLKPCVSALSRLPTKQRPLATLLGVPSRFGEPARHKRRRRRQKWLPV